MSKPLFKKGSRVQYSEEFMKTYGWTKYRGSTGTITSEPIGDEEHGNWQYVVLWDEGCPMVSSKWATGPFMQNTLSRFSDPRRDYDPSQQKDEEDDI